MTLERRDTFRVRPATREPIQVEMSGSGMLEMGHLVDISEGGMALRIEAEANSDLVGVEVELFIQFPAMHAAYTKGKIRSVRPDAGGSVLGVQFVALPAKTLDALREYVAGRGRKHSGNYRVG
jgi:c-di-GMP-binding flagellar brake protein YcgR